MNVSNDKCTLCGNRCYISNLRCKRGINHFARLEAEEVKKEKKEHKNMREHSGQHQHKHIKEDELTALLIQSNHFFHHKKGNKRGQGKILRILEEKGEMNQKDLQDLLSIESGSMSELVIKLEQKEFITRTKSEEDKRQVKLAITTLGLDKLTHMRNKESKEPTDIYAVLSADEKETLKSLLRKLNTSWESIVNSHHGCKDHSK